MRRVPAGLARAGLWPVRGLALALSVALALATGEARAQASADAPLRSPILTINLDQLIAGSELGRRMGAELEAERIMLEAENTRLAEELEAEEIALTNRRDTMPAEEFRAAARAFDEKVQRIRAERRALDLELAQRRDALQGEFEARALPVLAELMRAAGAGVILDSRSTVLSADQIDITRLAITRLDALTRADAPADDAPEDDTPADDAPQNDPATGEEPPPDQRPDQPGD